MSTIGASSTTTGLHGNCSESAGSTRSSVIKNNSGFIWLCMCVRQVNNTYQKFRPRETICALEKKTISNHKGFSISHRTYSWWAVHGCLRIGCLLWFYNNDNNNKNKEIVFSRWWPRVIKSTMKLTVNFHLFVIRGDLFDIRTRLGCN